jgi:hypothetical protein
MTAATSAGVGLVALIAAVLIWTIGKKHTPRLVLALCITSSVCFLHTRIGTWMEDGLNWINGTFGDLFGWLFGATVFGILGFVCAYIIFVDLKAHGGGGGRGGGGFLSRLKGHNVSGRTLFFGGLLPFAAVGLPGWAGYGILLVLNWISGFIAWGIDLLFR